MPRGVRATGYGAAGGRRDTAARSAKQRTRRDNRHKDPRFQAALEEVEATEKQLAEIDQQIKDAGPAAGAAHKGQYRALLANLEKQRDGVLVANHAAREVVTKIEAVPNEGDGGKGWTLGQARSMLHQGYKLWHVVNVTGFGARYFNDIPLDKDGRGISREEWIELQERRGRRAQIESEKIR